MRFWDTKNCNFDIFLWKGRGAHCPNPPKRKFRRRGKMMIRILLFTCPWWRQQAQCQELPNGDFLVAFLTIMLNNMNIRHLAADAVGRVGWTSMFCHSCAHCQVSEDSVNKLEERTKMPKTANKNFLSGPEAFFFKVMITLQWQHKAWQAPPEEARRRERW